jgi:hypothetical protein
VFAGCTVGSAAVPDVGPPPVASTPPPEAGPVVVSPVDDADAPDLGAIVVTERGCARCHQSPNPDDGVLSGQTAPRPGTHAYGANLTPDMETGIGGWSDAMILRAIRAGVDDGAKPLCTMPHYEDLSPDEGAQIVAYLRGLEPVRREIPASRCAEAGEVDAGEDATLDGAADAACGTYAAPAVPALCHACKTLPCQANGCFGGWFCETVSRTCHPAPLGCTSL